MKAKLEPDLILTLLILEMLIEQFIRAVKLFKNKPAMLKQTLHDAEHYYREGELTISEISILRKLANG